MPNIIIIDGNILEIYRHGCKNTFIGKFENNSLLPRIYGDTVNEVIDQANDIIRGINNELC